LLKLCHLGLGCILVVARLGGSFGARVGLNLKLGSDLRRGKDFNRERHFERALPLHPISTFEDVRKPKPLGNCVNRTG